MQGRGAPKQSGPPHSPALPELPRPSPKGVLLMRPFPPARAPLEQKSGWEPPSSGGAFQKNPVLS